MYSNYNISLLLDRALNPKVFIYMKDSIAAKEVTIISFHETFIWVRYKGNDSYTSLIPIDNILEIQVKEP